MFFARIARNFVKIKKDPFLVMERTTSILFLDLTAFLESHLKKKDVVAPRFTFRFYLVHIRRRSFIVVNRNCSYINCSIEKHVVHFWIEQRIWFLIVCEYTI